MQGTISKSRHAFLVTDMYFFVPNRITLVLGVVIKKWLLGSNRAIQSTTKGVL